MSEPDTELAELPAKIEQGDETALARLADRYPGIRQRAARALLGPLKRSHHKSLDVVHSPQNRLILEAYESNTETSTPGQPLAPAGTLIRQRAQRQRRLPKPKANSQESTTQESPHGMDAPNGRAHDLAGTVLFDSERIP